jgi:YVTN family beta-propeller protein
MKRVRLNLRLGAVLAGLCQALVYQDAIQAASETKASADYLSPAAVAADPEGNKVSIACATANEVVVFDSSRLEITRKLRVPAPPSGLALSADGKRLYVTCAAPQSTICLFDTINGKKLASIHTGHTAMSPVISRDEQILYVCNRFDNVVALIDLRKQKEIATIPVEREPVAETLTPDGKYLFVANHIHAGRSDIGVVAASVSVIDTAAQKVVRQIALPNGSTVLRGICASPDGRYVAVTHILARFHLPTTHVDHGWMNDNALSLIDVQKLDLLNTVLLDNVDRGAANPWGVAWSPDGQLIVVTHAGTHEVSVIQAPALLAKLAKLPVQAQPNTRSEYVSASRTIADVPNDLAFLVGLRSRIQLPGNGPRSLTISGQHAFIGCYFSDSVAIVDLMDPIRPIEDFSLQQPRELTVARKGEKYFNDGTLCFQGWQSCGTCHSSDARVDGMNWDLLNDGIGNPKNVKSLLLAFDTGPAMAMGVRANASAAVRAGIKHILFTELPEEYPAAIDEFIKSLKPIPSPHLVKGHLSSSAERGKRLFSDSKVGCVACHPPPLFTDAKAHGVGTGKFDDASDRFFTPTLVEIWRTAPYLHDGSAATLREAVTTHNRGDRRGKTSHLKPEDIDDLVAYLESL